MAIKKALVTGSSRGIGLVICSQLLQKGFSVLGTKNRSDVPDKLLNHQHFSIVETDLSDLESITSALKLYLIEDPPDVIINNAGIFLEGDIELSDEEWLSVWNKTMQVNLTSSSLLSKWYINGCIQNGKEGLIINIASRAAYRGDFQQYAAYAASKGGMAAFTKSIARDFSRKGILAYTIAPGFIKTEMAEDAIQQFGEEGLTKNAAFDEITSPEEVANLVTWLAGGEVKHMSGSTFHINGGSYMV
tara:strand:+ start:2725 stop:3462 length:738 start_codon:yes stop_codon:yes gene_type:complete